MNTAPTWKILRLSLAFGLVAVLGGCAHVPAYAALLWLLGRRLKRDQLATTWI